MTMHDSELAMVVDSLQDLVGRSMSGLWQPARDRVILEVGDRTLLMVPRGPTARLHSIDRRPKNPPRPFSFQGACRSRLRGRLRSFTKVPGDRVVRLTFDHGALELRLTGRSGGLWLLEDETVVAAYDGPTAKTLPTLKVRPVHVDDVRFEAVDGSWDLGARRFFTDLARDNRTRERRGVLGRQLRRTIDRTERLLVNLEGDLERADAAPMLRIKADLLAANLHRVDRGTTSITLEDWSTGDPVQIDLDPARPPSDTLEQLYRRAGRLDRVGDRVLTRLDEVQQELNRLRSALTGIDRADLASMRELEATLPSISSAPADGRSVPWWTWTGPLGERVLVGRNARGNRRLTFQVARGTDWWMHLRERPGAHVILPMKRDQTPNLSLLLVAAQITLVHAKIPDGMSADVQYARVRDVRPVPGEIALVRVADERVLRVTRDPAELVGWVRQDAQS